MDDLTISGILARNEAAKVLREQAAELGKQDAELARLREALKPFAKAFESDHPSQAITLHDLRMASEALEEHHGP